MTPRGRPPFGIRRDRTIDPAQVEVLREVFGRAAAGASATQIGLDMAAEVSRGNEAAAAIQWSHESVGRIVANSVYREPQGALGNDEPIVSEDLWQRANDTLFSGIHDRSLGTQVADHFPNAEEVRRNYDVD